MGPVPPIGYGAAFAASSTLRAGDQTPRVGRGDNRTGAVGAVAPGTTSAAGSVMRIDAAVTELLQSIGGGAKNDKVLRLMIALLILLALLGYQQNQDAQTQNVLRGLGTDNDHASSFAGLYTSSITTIHTQQSHTSVMFAGGYDLSGGGSVTSPTQLDTLA